MRRLRLVTSLAEFKKGGRGYRCKGPEEEDLDESTDDTWFDDHATYGTED